MRWYFSSRNYLQLIDIASPLAFNKIYMKFSFNLFLIPKNYTMNDLGLLKQFCISNNLNLNSFSNNKFFKLFGSNFLIISSNDFRLFESFFTGKFNFNYIPFLFYFNNYNVRLNVLSNIISNLFDKTFLYKFLNIFNLLINFSSFFLI